MEDQAQRTEPATPTRREEARKKGQVAQSRDLQSVLVLAAALGILSTGLGTDLAERCMRALQAAFTGVARPPGTLADYQALLLGYGTQVGLTVLPVMGALALIGGAGPVVQTGPMFSLEALQFRGERLDPIKGAKRFVDPDRLFDLVKTLVKIAVVGGASWWTLADDWPRVVGLSGSDLAGTIHVTSRAAFQVAAVSLVILWLFALVDVAYQRMRHDQRLRMSKREIRDELRQREGDPLLRSRFRARYRELSRTRMISEVANADAVVMNPTHVAVALRYDRNEMAAPRVVAKGRDRTALRIREIALRNDVPVIENPPLARLLEKTCEVGREVPDKLFEAVAEVLAYVYQLRPNKSRAWRAPA